MEKSKPEGSTRCGKISCPDMAMDKMLPAADTCWMSGVPSGPSRATTERSEDPCSKGTSWPEHSCQPSPGSQVLRAHKQLIQTELRPCNRNHVLDWMANL